MDSHDGNHIRNVPILVPWLLPSWFVGSEWFLYCQHIFNYLYQPQFWSIKQRSTFQLSQCWQLMGILFYFYPTACFQKWTILWHYYRMSMLSSLVPLLNQSPNRMGLFHEVILLKASLDSILAVHGERYHTWRLSPRFISSPALSSIVSTSRYFFDMEFVETVFQLTPVPYLDFSFAVFKGLWDALKDVQSSKLQFTVLAQSAAHLLQILDKGFRSGSLKTDDLSSDALADLERWVQLPLVVWNEMTWMPLRLLKDISAYIQKQSSFGFIKLLLIKDERLATIETFHRRISNSINAFHVSVWIAIDCVTDPVLSRLLPWLIFEYGNQDMKKLAGMTKEVYIPDFVIWKPISDSW